ncbi:MAG TPA: penicillin-binding protein 2 [Stenomitos sp.]
MHRFRFHAFAASIALVALLLCSRLVYLQILGQEVYSERADGNRLRIIMQPAPRGVIRDRNGVILATSRLSYSVTLYPIQTTKEQTDEVIQRLGKLLGMPADEIRGKWKKMGQVARPVRLMQDITPETIHIIAENQRQLPGVSIEPITIRYYPKGKFLAHVLGYTGEITDDELEKLSDQGYRAGDIIGKTGIEKVFDAQLRGEPGRQQIEVDARGKPMRILASVPPVPGKDLTLTIDANLQQVAESQLAGFRGSVVAMDPHNGEVLALASEPSFDPNWFAGRISPALWKQLNDANERPMVNRAISSKYPPGSIFKIVTHAAAMEEGIANWNSHFNSTGTFTLGTRVFHDWKRGGFGNVDFKRALVMSIDTVYYELGLKINPDRLARYARALGLGRQTGILLPHETSGLIPDPQWKKERAARGLSRDSRWYQGETVNMSIGQGYVQVSPLQAAVMIAAIANDGHVLRPKLVRPAAEQEKDDPPVKDEGVHPTQWKPDTWKMLHQALAETVSEGTGGLANVHGFPVAGKTGSAQSANGEVQKTHAWFAGYAPVGAPKIAVVAMKETAGHGGSQAAPVAGAVMKRFFGVADPNAAKPATASAKPEPAEAD